MLTPGRLTSRTSVLTGKFRLGGKPRVLSRFTLGTLPLGRETIAIPGIGTVTVGTVTVGKVTFGRTIGICEDAGSGTTANEARIAANRMAQIRLPVIVNPHATQPNLILS